MTSTLTFCGRDSEFERLLERWHMACDVQGASPQVVVIKAERGLGKTRFALEFYRWLNESVGGLGGARYWPSAVEVIERNLEVNPDLYACNFRGPSHVGIRSALSRVRMPAIIGLCKRLKLLKFYAHQDWRNSQIAHGPPFKPV
jgi:hypothetical protein